MSDSLGLSIGSTNLAAARTGRAPLTRSSVVTLFDHRAPEVGVPAENPNLSEPGLVMWGFVERVGDPIPLVASDGSPHQGEQLLAEALDAMARAVGDDGQPEHVVIAIPAHWGPAAVGALRSALGTRPTLFSDGAPPALITDAAAALAALRSGPGLPGSGVVALCDFGGSGTSITLADAGRNFETIGQTVRYPDFSGDAVDQAILSHVVSGISSANPAETARTAAVGSLTRLRGECRGAKERLSAETATVIPVELPGFSSDIRLTRAELEDAIEEPLSGFLDVLGDTLERNRIPVSDLAAVATVGGGAAIPLITQRLSDQLRVPLVTTPDPGLNAASGAAIVAEQGPSPDAATGMAAAAADMPTGIAPAAWAAGAAGALAGSASDANVSETSRQLAWSQDDSPTGEPVPYSGEDYTFDTGQGWPQDATGARPAMEFGSAEDEADEPPPPLPWYKRPPLLFGAAAAAALLAVGGLAVTLTSTSSDSPTESTTRVTETGQPTGGEQTATELPPESTVTVTGSNGRPTVSTIPAPPPPVTTPPPPITTTATTTPPTTTTTATTTTRTTTTTPPTTTPPTTTQPPTSSAVPPPTSIITGQTRAPDPEPDPPEPDPIG